MRVLRTLPAVLVASIGLADQALAMGSGPHPNVPYGLPPPPPRHSVPDVASPSLFMVCLVVAVVAVLVLTALMTIAENRHK